MFGATALPAGASALAGKVGFGEVLRLERVATDSGGTAKEDPHEPTLEPIKEWLRLTARGDCCLCSEFRTFGT